jgi:hypothetical protein
MQTYCMMNTLTDEQAENARLAVANYLAKNPQEDEHRAAVEGLAFFGASRFINGTRVFLARIV